MGVRTVCSIADLFSCEQGRSQTPDDLRVRTPRPLGSSRGQAPYHRAPSLVAVHGASWREEQPASLGRENRRLMTAARSPRLLPAPQALRSPLSPSPTFPSSPPAPADKGWAEGGRREGRGGRCDARG
eukprot:3644807-Rhodomonas_salina.2